MCLKLTASVKHIQKYIHLTYFQVSFRSNTHKMDKSSLRTKQRAYCRDVKLAAFKPPPFRQIQSSKLLIFRGFLS